jgi:hypothetical protein
VEQQNEFEWKIYIVCFHLGQMLFAGNKYILLSAEKDYRVHLDVSGQPEPLLLLDLFTL